MNEEIFFQVRLREHGPLVYAKRSSEEDISTKDIVVLKTEKGLDWGEVISSFFLDEDSRVKAVVDIIRKASKEDLDKILEAKKRIPEVMRIIRDKVEYHNLPMNLISAEYTFDEGKLIIYFVADDRVDFRQLVKDLAHTFKTRIEMRQIGVRDGARMLGALGICGREVCCALYLKEFKSMSIKMAKDQNLSLNPNKISGICGRLMCCLGYEWDVYRQAMKGLPRQGQEVSTEQGRGKVVEVNILQRKAKVEIPVGETRQYVWVEY